MDIYFGLLNSIMPPNSCLLTLPDIRYSSYLKGMAFKCGGKQTPFQISIQNDGERHLDSTNA